MPQTKQSKYWCFTINNPTDEDKPDDWGATYVKYQLEKGDDGTPHHQGYCEFDKLKRITALKKVNARAHWEQREGTQAQAIEYVSKEETRVEGPWELGTPAVSHQGKRTDLDAAIDTLRTEGLAACREQHATAYLKYYKGFKTIAKEDHTAKVKIQHKKKFSDRELRPWQSDLDTLLKESPDDRKIMWYWEDTGNVGKTWMAKYLMATRDATVLDCSKKADLTYLLSDHVGDTVIFNLTRSNAEEFMGHVYGLCESIKDDLVIQTKYESCHRPLGDQHVIVFSNREPDYEKWSSDRYDVHEITERPTKRQRTVRTDNAGAGRGPLATAR